LEVVEKQSVCGTIFESEFIELTKKLKLRIASSKEKMAKLRNDGV
jgi:hypothetical protein